MQVNTRCTRLRYATYALPFVTAGDGQWRKVKVARIEVLMIIPNTEVGTIGHDGCCSNWFQLRLTLGS